VGFCGLVLVGISALLLFFRSGSMFVPLALILGALGVGALGYAGFCVYRARQVTCCEVTCPFCQAKNRLVESPTEDFDCVECHRMIPIVGGKVLGVEQVRCGYCNELNYYSEKTEVLLCESCNHEIPILQADGAGPKKVIPKAFVAQEDEHLYELVLVAHGHKTEELMNALQHMLALNRNQVKQMLTELPVTLLTGITRKKAEMLAAQLAIHEGLSELHQLPDTAPLR
jgi:hypothetical protein